MKLLLLLLFFIIGCTKTVYVEKPCEPEKPEIPVEPIPDDSKIVNLPPEAPFQIMHIDDLEDLKRQLRPETKVVVLEISQVDGTKETDYLKSKGIHPVGYFSTTAENWRDEYDKLDKSVVGKTLDGWPDERWTNIKSQIWFDWIEEYKIKKAKRLGFTHVEYDNVDHFEQKTGFDISREDNIEALKKMSALAHKYGLGVCLKNTPPLSKELEPYFQCVMSEGCSKYAECHKHDAFKEAKKGLYGIEYTKKYCFKMDGWVKQHKDDYFDEDYKVCD